MEQQETPRSSQPPATTIRRGKKRFDLSASTPLRPSTLLPKENLWASEPSLRFPLPQGSQGLADWVSSSNPNMMHSEHVEECGMADSTYEIISAANTDTEEQDDQYPASMSESVGSLDIHHPDDVRSLAGSEHTCDEEESVPDDDDDDGGGGDGDDDSYREETPYEDDEERDDEDEDDDSDDEIDDDDDDDDDDEMHQDTILEPQTSHDAVESLSDSSDHEARSRCSLEYTQQSLGTPSLPSTPEGSRILVERPPECMGFKAKWHKKAERFWETEGQVKDYFVEATSAALPGLMFVLTFALILQLVHTPKRPPSIVPEATPVVATMTTTTTFTAFATAILTTTTTTTTIHSFATTSTAAQLSPTSAGAVGLIPVGDVVSDEWLFGASKPAISFTAQSQHDVLIHIPSKIKKTWKAKDCLTITAKRDEASVETAMYSVDQGIVVQFPKREVYGVVTLFLEATCRPKVHKVVKVHFGKGLMEGALEMTRNFAQDLSRLVPATAQEAERRLVDASRSLGSVCQNVCQNVQSASESMAKTLGGTFAETRQNLEGMAAEAVTHVSEQLSKVQDLQSTLQLYLLDAQVSANLWWLQATGRGEEHDEYQRKAEDFVARRHAEKERGMGQTPAEPAWSWWSRSRDVKI